MFLLKKIVGYALMPVPLMVGLLALGFLFLAFRRRGRGLALLACAWLVLLISANSGVALRLSASLENRFPPVPTGAADAWPAELREAAFVAVLGGGHGDRAALSANQRLSDSARARLSEGLRVATALPGTWLVVSGPADRSDEPEHAAPATHAAILAAAAVELGFPAERIVEIDTARDTAEEVAALHRLAGEERVALVTSAWHLPRAMRLAETQKLNAFPCPSDFLGGRDAPPGTREWLVWDADSLLKTTRAWREYVGLAWARIVRAWRE